MKYRSNYIIMIAPYFGYLPFLVKTSDKSSKHWSVALYKDVNSAQRNWPTKQKTLQDVLWMESLTFSVLVQSR